MPSTITPVATWTGTIPTPDDGEGATGGGLDGALQPLADREEFLKARLDAGVLKVREFADLTALAAGPGTATGEHAVVPNVGVYRWGAAVAAASPWRVPATGGTWYWVGQDAVFGGAPAAAGGGIVACDAAGKLLGGARPANGILASGSLEIAAGSSQTTTSASFVTLTAGGFGTLALSGGIAGDVVLIDGRIRAFIVSGASGTVGVAVDEAGGGYVEQEVLTSPIKGTSTPGEFHTFCQRYVVTNPGTISLRFTLKSNGADTATIKGYGLIRAVHVRP